MIEKFPIITDSLVLNFLNTRIYRNGKTIELMENVEDFYDWIDSQNQVDGEYSFQLRDIKKINASDFNTVISFRDNLYNTLIHILNGNMEIKYLENMIEAEMFENPLTIKFDMGKKILMPSKSNFSAFTTIILNDLANLMDSGEFDKLSRCSNPKCVLLFVDKTGRRKWCSMKICGNRNKVKRYSKSKKLSD